jgi:hypothetical protein
VRIFALFLAALTSAASIAPLLAAEPGVSWEVFNRFRLYRDAEVFRDYATVAERRLAGERGQWIMRTENRLQEKDGTWKGWAAASLEPFEVTEDGRKVLASRLCWSPINNPRTGFYSERDACADYAHPVSHEVLLRADFATLPADAECSWSIAYVSDPSRVARAANLWRRRLKDYGSTFRTENPCREARTLVPYNSSPPLNGARVRFVARRGGETLADITAAVAVTDRVVVGMGDSFGAGVGSPDQPVRLGRLTRVNYGRGSGAGLAQLPDRSGPDATARFLDARCFRSQYGPQFRAALHMAVVEKHAAVTFLDLACDGARVIEGLLDHKPTWAGLVVPQMQAFVNAMKTGPDSKPVCDDSAVLESRRQERRRGSAVAFNPRVIYDHPDSNFKTGDFDRPITLNGCAPKAYGRSIDYLFLSIGGNDIGFAPMVMHALIRDLPAGFLDSRYDALLRKFGAAHDGTVGIDRLRLLPQKLQHLKTIMTSMLPFTDESQSRVILSAYPLPVADEKGDICGSRRSSAASADCGTDALGGVAGGFSNKSIDTLQCQLQNREPAPGQEPIRDGLLGQPARPPADDGHNPGPSSAKVDDILRAACALNHRRADWMSGKLEKLSTSEDAAMRLRCAKADNVRIDFGQAPFPWTLAQGSEVDSWKHGFCARDWDVYGAVETHAMPVHGREFGGTPYQVALYRAYVSRLRWIRTTNDAYMTINWRTAPPRPSATKTVLDSASNLRSAIGTGALHPTAQGHSNLADRLLRAAMTHLCQQSPLEPRSEACRQLAYD